MNDEPKINRWRFGLAHTTFVDILRKGKQQRITITQLTPERLHMASRYASARRVWLIDMGDYGYIETKRHSFLIDAAALARVRALQPQFATEAIYRDHCLRVEEARAERTEEAVHGTT